MAEPHNSPKGAQSITHPPAMTLAERLKAAWGVLVSGSQRPFGPGQPLEPFIDVATPRQFKYPTYLNINITQPRNEIPGQTPFSYLRYLAASYDFAALCIDARVEEVQGMGYSIVAKNKRQQKDLQDACDLAGEFWGKPDKIHDFDAWMSMYLYDQYSIDAATIYKRPDQAGRLYSLDIVDGSTIKPLLDERGRVMGYQQILYGYPESEYMRDNVGGRYGFQELIYKPRWTRSFTPYGFPPTEKIVHRLELALKKQEFDEAHFTAGNIPAGLAWPPDGSLSPEQLAEFEANFNAALAGDATAVNKIKFIPWGMEFKEFMPFSYETTLDEWMARVTAAMFGVPMQELGFTNDVNRATAEMQEAVNERRGIKPCVSWLKTSLLDPVIQGDLGRSFGPGETPVSLPGQPTRPLTNPFKLIEWQWHFGDKQDALTQAQTHALDIQNGVITEQESRQMRYGDTLEGNAPGRPQPEPAGLGSLFGPQQPIASVAPVAKAAPGVAAENFFQGEWPDYP